MSLSFELTSETREFYGETHYRIRATRDIPYHNVKAGDLGGWVASTHVGDTPRIDGEAWVAENASVSGDAAMSGYALALGKARVTDSAHIGGYARVGGNVLISGNASVSGHASITGSAQVSGHVCVKGYTTIADNAQITGYTTVTGYALIGGNTIIGGNTFIGGKTCITGTDAEILKSSHHLTILNYYGHTVTIYRTRSGGLCAQIQDKHGDIKYFYNDELSLEWLASLPPLCADIVAE